MMKGPTAMGKQSACSWHCSRGKPAVHLPIPIPHYSQLPAGSMPTRTKERQVRGICRAREKDSPENSPDLVERFVGMLFGKKALESREPFGMKRLSAEDAPEMFPATLDEWADPVEGDSKEVAVIRPLLAGTRLRLLPLRLAYCAERDGWSAADFHAQVDTFGAAVVLARTEGGAICGGYNPKGWIGLGEDRDAIAAFLFTWPDGDTSKRPIKLRKVGGSSLAVMDKADSGPKFGADGLYIPLNNGGRTAQSRLGSYYSKLPNGGRSLFADGENWKSAVLVDLKVFVLVGEGESWELDGIVWTRGNKNAE